MRVANSNITTIKMDVMQFDESIIKSYNNAYYFRGLYTSEADLYGGPTDIGIGFGDTARTQSISNPVVFTRGTRMYIQTGQVGGLYFSLNQANLWTKYNTKELTLNLNANSSDTENSPNIAFKVGTEEYMNMYGTGTGRYVYLRGTKLRVGSNATVSGSLTVSGTKSRKVSTDDYSDRLLYAYETPSPMFGDLGSGTIGEDGLCYVEIDDIFTETARADLAYQVFLQKCGEGDLWVDSKAPTHFIVRGTPGLRFDWELKAKQLGFETLRLEDADLGYEYEYDGVDESAYADELDWIGQVERALYEAA